MLILTNMFIFPVRKLGFREVIVIAPPDLWLQVPVVNHSLEADDPPSDLPPEGQ